MQEVREQLRRLGYLESGLDRFVLSGANSPSPLRALLGAAVRVGAAGGVVLGVALTLVAASLDPLGGSGTADLLVLAAYLVVFSALAAGAAAFAGGLAAAWIGRRTGREPGPNLARNVGLALALPGLAYLALVFRSQPRGTELVALLAFAALGLVVSALLGRFGTLAAVAVLSAGGVAGRLPRAGLSRRHMLPLLLVAALVLGAGLAVGSLLATEPEPAPDFAVIPTGLRVRVVGIDGLERRMAAQMMARGEMPHLAALLARGARAELVAEREQVPAIVWTTVATGRGPEAHGIHGAGARRLAGMRGPVPLPSEGRFAATLARATDLVRLTQTEPPSAVLRGAKAFWNVASDKGLRVGVVNWWATWPAEPLNGYLVTDRAFFKLERGGPPEREVHPEDVFGRLAAAFPGEGERARRLDLFHAGAARLLREPGPPDLEAVYLSGLDILTMQRLGPEAAFGTADLDARLEQLRADHRFLDGLLGELASSGGANQVLVLVGDPGRFARRSEASPRGLLVLAGGPVRAMDLAPASERDVAPTVLHLLGLPVSREIEGRVLETAFGPEFRAAHPVRTVSGYGRRPRRGAARSGFDREMVEELRALGYIK